MVTRERERDRERERERERVSVDLICPKTLMTTSATAIIDMNEFYSDQRRPIQNKGYLISHVTWPELWSHLYCCLVDTFWLVLSETSHNTLSVTVKVYFIVLVSHRIHSKGFFVLFFTPIPCTYTSSPLDGMARNFLIHMDTQDHVIRHVWIHFIPTSLYPRRRKTFGLSWNRTQVLLLHMQPLWPLDHGSSGILKACSIFKLDDFYLWIHGYSKIWISQDPIQCRNCDPEGLPLNTLQSSRSFCSETAKYQTVQFLALDGNNKIKNGLQLDKTQP